MTHNVRIRLDPPLGGGWARGTSWAYTEQQALDNALIAAVNGDGGGSWSPTANLTIGGSGLRLIGTTHTLTGSGSIVATNPGAVPPALLTHGDSDWCVLGSGHTGATQTLTSPILDAVWSGLAGATQNDVAGGSPWLVEGIGVLGAPPITSTILGATARVPLRVHQNATIDTVTFSYEVLSASNVSGAEWAGVPSQLPQFGVFAADCFGNTFPLSANTTGGYQVPPAPANTSAWINSSNPQTFVFHADAASSNPYCFVDTTQFTYFAEIVEVSGANALVGAVVYLDPVAVFTDILDIRPR